MSGIPDASSKQHAGSLDPRLRILVAGASGFIGTRLCRHLAHLGHQVVRLVRGKPDGSGGEIGWDPGAGRLAPDVMPRFDAVVSLAGENIAAARWSAAVKQRIRDSRIETAGLLARAMAAAEPRPNVFVCASAVGYYGDRGDAVLTEDAPPGDGFLAQVCHDWEQACEPARAAGVRVVNLRIGVVLSPAGGALAKMLPVFKVGMGGTIGSGNQWVGWIAMTDLLRVFGYVLENDSLAGAVNAVSPKPVTNRQFTKAVGAFLGRPTIVPLPASGVKLTMGEMGVEMLLASARVVPDRLESAGFAFKHASIEDALQHEMAAVQ